MGILQLAVLGATIGLPMGYAMQRTNLCFSSAYREALLRRKTVLLHAILLAVLIQMVGVGLLVQFNVGGIRLNVVPFYWITAILGGFAFGIAMVYAEGCSSTVWYRVGNGNMGSLVTLIGFALGEAATTFGPLRGLRETLQGAEITLSSGAPATLPNAIGVSPWLLVLPIVLAGGWWLARGKAGSYLGGWDWRLAGLVLGIIGAAAWVVSWPTGWSYGIGIVGATGAIVRAVFEGPRVLNWGSFVVLTMPVGALVAALHTKQFRWQIPDWPSTFRMTTAGAVMGISATLAGGCNIGHGFSGLPTLALSSLTATLFTFLGAWTGNYVRFTRTSRQVACAECSEGIGA
jgi:uncharacterized membrane protein YedE/YeeE